MAETKDKKKKETKVGGDKKPKFNFYWVYGLIALILLGLQFLGSESNSKKSNWKELETAVVPGDDRSLPSLPGVAHPIEILAGPLFPAVALAVT